MQRADANIGTVWLIVVYAVTVNPVTQLY
jgi:hypothetical protein